MNPPWWLAAATRAFGLRCEILDHDGIRDATELLYRVYTKEQGWDPPGPNPSELWADHEAGRLLDAYTDGATWLGLRDRGDRLVATIRLIHRQRFETLEIERYIELPKELTMASLEANRVAVLRSHRRSPALVLLFMFACHVGRKLGATYGLATAYPRVVMGPARTYGWEPTGHTFRYHSEDPQDVLVMRYDLRLRHQAGVLASAARRKLTRTKRNPRKANVRA